MKFLKYKPRVRAFLLIVFVLTVYKLWQSYVLGPSHYFQYKFEGTFDGEPIYFVSNVECRPELRHDGIGGGVGLYRGYETYPAEMVAHLNGGGVLVFRTPAYCRFSPSTRQWKVYWKPGNSVYALPMISWFDDVDNPQKGENYIHADYYRHPNARLKVNDSTVAFVKRGVSPYGLPSWMSYVFSGSFESIKRSYSWFLVPLPSGITPELLGLPIAKGQFGQIQVYEKTDDLEAAFLQSRQGLIDYVSRVMTGTPLNLPKELLSSLQYANARRGSPTAALTLPLLWDGEAYVLPLSAPSGLRAYYTGGAYPGKMRNNPILKIGRDQVVLPTAEFSWADIVICIQSKSRCYIPKQSLLQFGQD